MTSTENTIDYRYLKQVKDYTPIPLPRPRKKGKKIIYDEDGKIIPIITVTIGAFE